MVIYEPEFILTALQLGYSQKDIYPVLIQQIQKQFYEIIKKMPINEKDFYLFKKFKIYQARRQRIIKQIQKQIQQNRKRKQNKNLPVKLRQIYSQHQKRIVKNQRYQQTLMRGLQSSGKSRKKHQIANTIDFGRRSPIQINNQRGAKLRSEQSSRSSKENSRSQASQKSSRSKLSQISQNLSQVKLRLSQIRQKQKNIQQYKKKMLKEKLKRDQIKMLKAEQTNLNKSYKAKARSQISRKIINQNKKQIQLIQRFQQKNHYEGFKFKLQKNQFNRNRNIKNISQDKKKSDFSNTIVNLIKSKQKQILTQKKKQFRYSQKKNYLENSIYQISDYRRPNLNSIKKQKQARSMIVDDIRRLDLSQKNNINGKLIYWQQKKQQYAQQKRLDTQQQRRKNLISQNIRREIALQNYKSLQLQEKRRIRNQQIKLNQRLQNVKEIQKFKKILIEKQKQKFGRVYKDFGQNQIVNTTGPKSANSSIVRKKILSINMQDKYNNQPIIRNSFTSNKNNRNINYKQFLI